MNERDTHLKLSETCRAPHLCQLVLMNFAEPQILTTMANLVNLSFIAIPSAYFHTNSLLHRLTLLATLGIDFKFYDFSHDVKRQLLHMPFVTRVILRMH